VAFYQKYRPKFFVDLIGEDHIRETLLEASKGDKMSHAFLLCGPRGTGKTTTARLLAKVLNCQQIIKDRAYKKEITGEPCNKCEVCLEINEGRAIDVVEIDAASHTKVDEIREVIDKARFMPAKLTKKVYIVDEVHMLSTSSFNALLKTLEEPPAHVVFILATTEVHKLPATIVSRVQRYDFRRIKKDDIIQNLKKIAKAEKIEIDDKVLDLIAVKAEGGHRDAVSLLEQISATGDTSYENASKVLGHSDSGEILAFLEAIFSNLPEE
jgi:DNA polymerase III subunit gamma/tau